MLKLTLTIHTQDPVEFETALEEVSRLVAEGNTSGADRNEDARFSFTITDES